MPVIKGQKITEVKNKIEDLVNIINTAGDNERDKLSKIDYASTLSLIPIDPATGQIDTAAWGALDPKVQISRFGQLEHVRNSLSIAAGLDGPTDENHLMYSQYASNYSIIFLLVFSVVLIIILLLTISQNWNEATGGDYQGKLIVATESVEKLDKLLNDDASADTVVNNNSIIEARQDASQKSIEAIRGIIENGVSEEEVLLMVILLGALGGSLHMLASFVRYVGNRQLKRSWILYYLSAPLMGAILAPIVYMLLRVGVLSPSTGETASSTSNLNLLAIYAFAALTGLFAKTASDKLSEVFSTLFRTVGNEMKDKLGPEKPGD